MNNLTELEYLLNKINIQQYEKELHKQIRAWYSVSKNNRYLLDAKIYNAAELYFEVRKKEYIISSSSFSLQIENKDQVLYLMFYPR